MSILIRSACVTLLLATSVAFAAEPPVISWAPSAKSMKQLAVEGYEVKTTGLGPSALGSVAFFILQKGPSVYRCYEEQPPRCVELVAPRSNGG